MNEDDPKTEAGDPIVDAIERWLGRPAPGYDYVRIGKLLAAVDTARFVEQHMPTAPIFRTVPQLHRAALEQRGVAGLVMEFGVASGKSVNFLAKQLPGQTVHGFDSFEGLPEDWLRTYRRGHFAQPLPKVEPNVELVVGWFEDTLPGFLRDHPEPVSYLHVDCDLYSSTKTIFDHLGDRIRAGTVIVFDEYFNYPSWREHEHKAFTEFVERRKVRFHFLGAVRSGVQAAVVIDSIG